MIQIKLSSGLGNQLFMYAFYRYIEFKYKVTPFFDDRYYLHETKIRKPELSIIFPNYPVKRFLFNPAGHSKIIRTICNWKQKLFPDYLYIYEDDYDDKTIYIDNVYFSGFWQTSRYADTLDKSLFKAVLPIPEELRLFQELINKTECPVAIHFRRGDYFMPKWIDRYGVCTEIYYQRAMEHIAAMENRKKTYFVFSDDLDWVKSHIEFADDVIYVPNIDVNSYWYIYLMSKCQHNIISNSTFSWWGAYLNESDNKLVIGPNKWMLDSDFDLMKPEWIKIPVK